jgi:hypothetical protein
MDAERDWTLAAVATSAGFPAAHLIDEFVWGAPAAFHLTVTATEALSLAYMLAVVGLLVLAARGRRGAYLALAIGGGLILAADILKHGVEILAPGPWRGGPVPVGPAAGLMISALRTAAGAVRRLRGQPRPDHLRPG